MAVYFPTNLNFVPKISSINFHCLIFHIIFRNRGHNWVGRKQGGCGRWRKCWRNDLEKGHPFRLLVQCRCTHPCQVYSKR